jgi:adenylylsulfate kinase-like enzyme
MDTLVERDIKNLYAPALRGEIKDVVGVDIPFPDPPHADLIIDNDNYLENLTPLVDQVLSLPAVAEVASL